MDPHSGTPLRPCPHSVTTTQTPSAPVALHRVKVLKVPNDPCHLLQTHGDPYPHLKVPVLAGDLQWGWGLHGDKDLWVLA